MGFSAKTYDIGVAAEPERLSRDFVMLELRHSGAPRQHQIPRGRDGKANASTLNGSGLAVGRA
jgi:hypothetical protein